jgi:hypothetical protein
VKATLALTLALLAVPANAQEGPQPVLAEGEAIEADLRADLNADGHADLAYIAAREDSRELRLVTSTITEVEIGKNPPQILTLDPYPLGDGALKLKGNVLLLEELTGGTTAVFSTHRFRWDAKLQAMRLIGLDATLYSRTFAHDGREASWNLLTGDFTSHRLKLRGDGGDTAYDEVDKKRTRKRSAPVRLEDTPSGDDLLGWPGAK